MARVRLRTIDRVPQCRECQFEFVLNGCLSVHQPYRAKIWGLVPYPTEPRDHLRPIGMCAVAIDDFNARVKRDVFAENVKNGLPLDYSPTQSVLGLKADHKYGVAGIAVGTDARQRNRTAYLDKAF